MKTCKDCLVSKCEDEFYYGQGACKECRRAAVRRNRALRIGHYKAYERGRASAPHRVSAVKAYAKTDAGKAAAIRAKRKQIAKHPEKRRARVAVGNAVRDGRLKRGPCSCGSAKTQAHHHDYSKPLEVEWLCSRCHRDRHREQERQT